MISAIGCRYFRRAFGWCVPIGGLGGLIGLGGGEFRLPLLMYGIGFDARSAVPLNLLISLVTLAFALIVRSQTTSIVEVAPHFPEMAGLLAGGMVSAFFGASLVSRLGNARLVRLIAAFLGALGLLMVAESFLPLRTGDLLAPGFGMHFGVGLVIGIGVGLVSNVLGVAGGELLIPTLILVFGADVKAAGSASIIISIGVVMVGLWRYWRAGAISIGGGPQRIVTAMAACSIVGTMLGGLCVAYAPAAFLKVFLGCIVGHGLEDRLSQVRSSSADVVDSPFHSPKQTCAANTDWSAMCRFC